MSKPSHTFAADELGFIRVAQNGTFYTCDTLIHSGLVENTRCKFCSGPDSVFHRHWECSHTQPSRALIPVEVHEYILQAHGWATEPEEITKFRMALHQIPCTLGAYVPLGVQRQHVDLFCDGTGIDPKMPLTRLVAWAVVLAGAHPPQPHQPLSWGGVPGPYQIVRSELYAFVSSVIYCHRHVQSPDSTCAIHER